MRIQCFHKRVRNSLEEETLRKQEHVTASDKMTEKVHNSDPATLCCVLEYSVVSYNATHNSILPKLFSL